MRLRRGWSSLWMIDAQDLRKFRRCRKLLCSATLKEYRTKFLCIEVAIPHRELPRKRKKKCELASNKNTTRLLLKKKKKKLFLLNFSRVELSICRDTSLACCWSNTANMYIQWFNGLCTFPVSLLCNPKFRFCVVSVRKIEKKKKQEKAHELNQILGFYGKIRPEWYPRNVLYQKKVHVRECDVWSIVVFHCRTSGERVGEVENRVRLRMVVGGDENALRGFHFLSSPTSGGLRTSRRTLVRTTTNRRRIFMKNLRFYRPRIIDLSNRKNSSKNPISQIFLVLNDRTIYFSFPTNP